MRNPTVTAAVLLCSFVLISGARAEDAAGLQKEITELKEVQKAIQKDLQEIKDLLKNAPRAANGPAPLPASMDASSILAKGDAKAPITIVEYTDMQCPFCSRHAQNTFSQIDNEYIKAGKVRYIVK